MILFSVESVEYTLIQETGTGTNAGGMSSGAYFFTLIGSKDETVPHDCVADRDKASVSECSFEDGTEIGKLKRMRIKNKTDDTWVVVGVDVKINGVLTGSWKGYVSVGDYSTKSFTFTRSVYPIGLKARPHLCLKLINSIFGEIRAKHNHWRSRIILTEPF